jgi:hypothetical protein
MPTEKRFTTRRMSDQHEDFLAILFGGRKSRGSGNQFNDQMDGRNHHETPFALAWDGKSTYNKSVGVTLEMWRKAIEQADYEIPILALRFYEDQTLARVTQDLVVIDAHRFTEILEAARRNSSGNES